MSELIVAVAAGLLWVLPFLLLVLAARSFWRIGTGVAVLAAYPVFFAGQVLLAKVAGIAGFLHVAGLRVSYAVLVVVGGVALWYARRNREMRGGAAGEAGADPDTILVRRIVVGLVVLTFVGLTLFTLVSPVHVWDVLAYHMPMVASYVQNGSLEPWPTQELRQVYRVNAGELQLLNVALLARSDAWVELPGLLGLGVVLCATRELARLALSRRVLALLAVGLVLTAPQIVVAGTTAKNDLTFTAVLLGAFYWALWAGRGGRAGSAPILALALAGLSGALAAATKVMGLNVLGATGLLLLVLAWRGRLRSRDVLAFAALAVVALGLLAGDVYWRNLMREAIPVGVAPGELHLTFGLANLVEAVRFYAYELSFRRLVVPPPFEHDFLHYGYLFPFVLVLGIMGGLRQWRRREYALAGMTLAGGALFASVIALRIPIQWDQRFMIWLVPVAGLLALSLMSRIAGRHLVALAGLIAGLTLTNLTTGLLVESDRLFLRSARHLAGTGTLARYTDVPNQGYRARDDGFEALDREAGPSDEVLYAGTEDSWMYLAWGPRFTRRVEGVRDPEHAAGQVASGRFRFIVVEDGVGEGLEAAISAEADRAGYTTLASARGRTILVRP